MPNRRQEEKENWQYFRTTCGLIGFIVFFLGSFFAFIVAEETGEYYEYTIIFGFVMLFATSVFFCCVLHESKRIHSTEKQPDECLRESNEPQLEQELLLQPRPELPLQPEPELPPQPEPELSGKPKKEPHWYDKTRLDFAYVRQILGLPPRDSNETTSSENDSDPDMLELRKMAKSGLPASSEEPMAGTSKESQDKEDAARCEGAADFQLDSTKAGPSKVAGKSSEVTESRSGPSLKDMSALSLSDSSKYTTASEEKQAEVSAALSKLSLDSFEKQASKMAVQDPSSADSEGKSDEHHSQHAETSIKSEDGESSKLELKKEA